MVKHAIMLTVYSDSLTMPPDKKKQYQQQRQTHLPFSSSFCASLLPRGYSKNNQIWTQGTT